MNKRIVKCKDCDYRALIHIDRKICKHCNGKLEIIAETRLEELNK